MSTSRRSMLLSISGVGATFFVSPGAARGQTVNQGGNKATTAADPLKGLRASKDEMRGISFYEHPSGPRYRNVNGFFLYFGKETGGRVTDMRLVMQYKAERWLFVERAWCKADGVDVVPPQIKKFSGWDRDNGNGGIWEWSDATVTSSIEKAAIRRIANARNVTVRFEGKQYYNDRKLSERELSAMREMISIYEKLTGKPWQ